jgi:hypothetical protein
MKSSAEKYSAEDFCVKYKLRNQFYFHKIIHEFSKANIPDARVNK